MTSFSLLVGLRTYYQLPIYTDRSALLALKSQITSTGSITSDDANSHMLEKNWTISSSSTSVCDWVGVTCSKLHLRVAALDLHGMGLTGTIPPHLGNLSFLVSLDLSSNNFRGHLPMEMARLRRLKHIDISVNNIVGNIPPWFGMLPQLQSLYIWNNSFTGHIPTSLSNCSNLMELDTSLNPLNGIIPQEIGNLTKMTRLVLQENQLSGSIPPSIFSISSLELIDFSSNSISGHLPKDMCTSLPKLHYISLSENDLEGEVPSSLGSCSRLQMLGLSVNKFHGPIPSSLGNLTMLERLYLGSNFLGGVLPESIGSLGNLEILLIEANNLSGHVPASFFNISSLTALALAQNNFTGQLPLTIGSGLPNLEGLYVGGNGFTGTVSDSISNASQLSFLDLSNNKFTGPIPCNLGSLRLIEKLFLGGNNFVISTENNSLGSFILSLTSCKLLKELRISGNPLNTNLPINSFNLSTSLQVFSAYSCGITGKIPREIGNISSLIDLNIPKNQFVGSLPDTLLQGFSNLQGLAVGHNSLNGSIPNDLFCHLPRMTELDLEYNDFSGSFPADCLGNVSSLRKLNLDGNKFSSNIPSNLWDLKDLLLLSLSSNSFTGHLSPEIGSLRAAVDIDLSMNQLSGQIPSTVGSLLTLSYLSLAHNNFQGSIPELFGKLVSLEGLDLSYNNLSGVITKSLEALSLLKYLNLSFNRLSGEIPSNGSFKNLTYLSFLSNGALCGPSQFGVQQCRDISPKKRRAIIPLICFVVLGILLLALVLLAAVFSLLKWRKKHQTLSSVEDMEPAITRERISYHELLQGTNSFNESNLLGVGSFGSVYKCEFRNGRTLAVKVFNLQNERAVRSFETECEMLRNIRHRNLTKIITSCTNLDFMALVLEYMPNGNLDMWLHSDDNNHLLDMKQRLDMMIDVASALDYLDNGYSVPVVHCDLKPSNVLVNEHMIAHVSDFGISKFLTENGSVAQTKTLATIGYTAPEYGSEGLVSTSCDVYSFGIMLMEVFTRKRPTDEMFSGDLSLKGWVNDCLANGVMGVVDGNLLTQQEGMLDQTMIQCVSSVLQLASHCSADSPEQRMKMDVVLASLKKLRVQFIASIV